MEVGRNTQTAEIGLAALRVAVKVPGQHFVQPGGVGGDGRVMEEPSGNLAGMRLGIPESCGRLGGQRRNERLICQLQCQSLRRRGRRQ